MTEPEQEHEADAGAGAGAPAPSPELSPRQVVRIQLEALRRNGELGDDVGIAITFRFASEANRRATGPLAKFARMLRNPLYLPMLDHSSTAIGPTHVDGRVARLQVVLFGRAGEVAAYDFTLCRDERTDCWMTDAVALSPVESA